ncbi:hypothetical protein RBG61_01975 [Paludicola sp. MB14-C6]|uniref:hypothetical protein n=1 Tax=Paludihabitans sp. MB14-C6 TaxID=3070656 RepID=UPI0027DDC153|nr:hypothetical protein [Paludicola sp. MB14-C6]WMJ23459.1 hypothetical protein RBG61_01975 [Paludicola sp. MB14-C6]
MKHLSLNTGVKFSYLDSSYKKGVGSVDEWVEFTYKMGESTHFIFPAEWTNAFGNDVFQAESLKIRELATVRMGYNPDLFKILNTKKVKIWRNNETGDKNAFTVYGPSDNVKMRDQMLEFKVQRLEVKPCD